MPTGRPDELILPGCVNTVSSATAVTSEADPFNRAMVRRTRPCTSAGEPRVAERTTGLGRSAAGRHVALSTLGSDDAAASWGGAWDRGTASTASPTAVERDCVPVLNPHAVELDSREAPSGVRGHRTLRSTRQAKSCVASRRTFATNKGIERARGSSAPKFHDASSPSGNQPPAAGGLSPVIERRPCADVGAGLASASAARRLAARNRWRRRGRRRTGRKGPLRQTEGRFHRMQQRRPRRLRILQRSQRRIGYRALASNRLAPHAPSVLSVHRLSAATLSPGGSVRVR